ncbi:MlaC/ttg2D family ABC transporter substrate-binding protein [Catenovulum sediminis]|uniref:ABC transporter substrate-binding protein n=1 Tax=Catenovulum sediminis TaxID=1740262 RepID=A0ABV1RK43_9ALTE|nr:ABC transporter substrate-binding protein [Catenovulum sediminis]
MRSLIKTGVLLSSCLFFIAPVHSLQAAEQSQILQIDDPYVLFDKVTQKAFERFKAEWPLVKQQPEKLKEIIREELLPYIDYEYAAFKVLGKHVREVKPDDRRLFVDAFKDYIVTVYAQLFAQYKETQSIIVEPSRDTEGNKIAVVKSKIIEPGRPDINVMFKLINRDDRWRAFDMEAEGISVLNTKRKEIDSAMPRMGISGIIKDLKDKAQQKLNFKDSESTSA